METLSVFNEKFYYNFYFFFWGYFALVFWGENYIKFFKKEKSMLKHFETHPWMSFFIFKKEELC